MAKEDKAIRVVVEHQTTFDLPYPRTKPVILSVLGSLIYIGTQTGSLMLLSIDSHSTSRSISLVGSVSFGYSSLDALILLPVTDEVVVLCDGSIYITDSQLTQPIRTLNFSKGVNLIAKRVKSKDTSQFTDMLSSSPGASSENFSILKKLGALKLKAQEKLPKRGEFVDSLNSKGRNNNETLFVCLVGKKLILSELISGSLGDDVLMVLKEIPCMEDVKTIAWVNDSIIAGTSNGYSLFSCVTGNSGVICTFPNSYGSPLVQIMWKETKVLLLMDNVGVIADHHGQPVGGSLVFKWNPDSVREISSYVAAAKNGRMELYHKKRGNCIQSVVFGSDGDVRCMIGVEENGSGDMVVALTDSKVVCYRKVACEEQIKDLLRKKNFNEAITLVEELEHDGELSKEIRSFVHAQVGFLLLFELHFEEAVDHFLLSETMEPSEIFPFIMRDPNRWSLLVPRNRYWGLHPPPASIEDIVDDGLLSIQRAIFLKKAGVETTIDEMFLFNPPTKAALLEVAIKNIIRYLEHSREKVIAYAVKEGVDTLLVYLYRTLNRVDDMEKLTSSENACLVEELESLLKESGHLRALAFLYASKGSSSKALDIWHVLAKRSFSAATHEAAIVESNENGLRSGREISAIEAKKILETSSDQNLVLRHLDWVAEVNPSLAVDVLISEKRNFELSPDEVIAAIGPKNVKILQRYLQWLIEDQGSNDTRFHTLYALSLAKTAIEASDDEKDEMVRDSLQIFLQLSDLYDSEEVLDIIERSELWLEKAILYRKLGHEKLVLQILALKLEDCDAAEQYCAEIGRPDAYMQLLDMYLDPQNGREPMFNAAVRLLHSHGELLDPLQVLETLSPEMPLHLAADTILRMLRARLHHYHQGKIVHSMSQALHVDSLLARMEERTRHVQINDETLCDSCHARLGTKLFAMYPDDTILCYKCFRRSGDSMSISGRDFKRDIVIKPGWLVTR